tara:strand:- start:57 stop:536 length:480 start_codon:yes stop_codon:yes gene_type:complete
MHCRFATSVSGFVRADIKHPSDIAFERFVGALEYKRQTFDFAALTREGECVFVGEGDLSFAYALATCPKSRPTNVVATTYVSVSGVCPAGRANARALQKVGAFDLPGAAKWAACGVEDVFPFFRSAWPGYGHVNTNAPKESALSRYRSTSIWVFRPLGR